VTEPKDIALALCQAEWQWSRAWWEAQAAAWQLSLRESKGSRRTYADPDGVLWDVYFDEGSLLQVEIELEAFVAVETLSDSEYEDKIDEYADKFETTAKDLQAALGKPVFIDGSAAKGFPEDQDAAWLALWHGRNARVMLQQKHESREFPFRLVLVVSPSAV
jgi:hypothetical protein